MKILIDSEIVCPECNSKDWKYYNTSNDFQCIDCQSDWTIKKES